MVWLPDGEKILKICLFVLTESMNVTDRHTHIYTWTDRHCIMAKAALDASIAKQKSADFDEMWYTTAHFVLNDSQATKYENF